MDQGRLRNLGSVDATGFTESPALDLPTVTVEGIDVGCGTRRNHVERQVAIVLVPVHVGDDGFRQSRDGVFFPRGRVVQVDGVLVGEQELGLPILLI